MDGRRRLSLTIELPNDQRDRDICALRQFLKALIRSYGIRFVALGEDGKDIQANLPEGTKVEK